MADGDDVPPLEDMSELLHQVESLKEYKNTKPKSVTASVNRSATVNTSQNRKSNVASKTPTKTTDIADCHITSKSDSAFGGLKKGFMFGGPPRHTKSKPLVTSHVKDDVPLIKPKESPEKQFELPEVQQAMSAGEALLKNTDWITDDILGNVQSNDVIFKRLQDPMFMQAISEFQTNPTDALQKYKDNKDIMSFLQVFCGLMGNHFNKLADQQQQSTPSPVRSQELIQVHNPGGADLSVHSSTNPKQATAADERKMQDILANPEIHEILLDARIQKLMETLRTDPEKAQRALQVADVDLRRKIQRLVEVGLLQFQS